MELPKTEVYAAYVAGVVSVAILAWLYWKSQLPPPDDGASGAPMFDGEPAP